MINVYGRPEALNFLSSTAFADAMASLRQRIKTAQASLPPLPQMPQLPAFTMPTLPPLPASVKVPYRVQVQAQDIPIPPLPTLPPLKVPEKLIVHRIEVERPSFSLPSASMPTLRPIQVEYLDVQPTGKKPAKGKA